MGDVTGSLSRDDVRSLDGDSRSKGLDSADHTDDCSGVSVRGVIYRFS